MRDFDAEQQARHDDTPIEARRFRLGGEEWTRLPEVPIAAVNSLSGLRGDDDARDLSVVADALVASVEPDERAYLRAMLADPDNGITLGTINAIFEWIIGESTGRPPTSRGDSSTRRGRTGTRSTRASRSPESTPALSASADS